MNSTKAGLGVIVPALLNPSTAVVLAIGLIGFGLIKLLGEEDDGPDFNGEINPRKRNLTAEPTVDTPPSNQSVPQSADLEEPVAPKSEAVTEPFVSAQEETLEAKDPDAAHRDMIRQYMSELGKRSAVARAKKRASKTHPPLD